jgi:hypothetical protein
LREERRLRVFETRLSRRIFGPKRDEVTRVWRKLNEEELNGPYPLPNIIRMIKSRIMRWAGHVARMGQMRGLYRVLVGNLRKRNHLQARGVNARIILRRIFRKWDL